jgi:hypothetical protein
MNVSWNSNIEFDTLFFEVKLEKKDYFSVHKYFVLHDQIHGVVYICIFYINFDFKILTLEFWGWFLGFNYHKLFYIQNCKVLFWFEGFSYAWTFLWLCKYFVSICTLDFNNWGWWRTPNSLKDSNVSPSERQRKREESGCAP